MKSAGLPKQPLRYLDVRNKTKINLDFQGKYEMHNTIEEEEKTPKYGDRARGNTL